MNIRIRKISSIIMLALAVFFTTKVVKADESKTWNIEHKVVDMYFYGGVTFSERSGWFKSVITYYGNIGGPDKGLSLLSCDSFNNLYRKPNDEVGTLMISTKNYHNGNCVRNYVARNNIIHTSEYKDYLSKINVDLQFGTTTSYKSQSFTLDD